MHDNVKQAILNASELDTIGDAASALPSSADESGSRAIVGKEKPWAAS